MSKLTNGNFTKKITNLFDLIWRPKSKVTKKIRKRKRKKLMTSSLMSSWSSSTSRNVNHARNISFLAKSSRDDCGRFTTPIEAPFLAIESPCHPPSFAPKSPIRIAPGWPNFGRHCRTDAVVSSSTPTSSGAPLPSALAFLLPLRARTSQT